MAKEKVSKVETSAAFSFTEFIAKQKSTLDKDLVRKMGTGDSLPPVEYLTMPSWWQEVTGVPGLPYRRIVILAGDSDSGKTSSAIEAMVAAQKEQVDIIYCETELKTDVTRLQSGGVDTSRILVIQSNVAEEMFQLLFDNIRAYKEANPEGKLLIVVDSLGNITNLRDVEMDMLKDSQGVGSKGKINRNAMQILTALTADASGPKIATLLINYTYDSMGYGAPTKVIAGGKGPFQYSSLIYILARKAWIEQTSSGVKYRKGIKVLFKLVKNHLNVANQGAKSVEIDITNDGFKVVGKED